MYTAEVLGKLPVAQHFFFGSILPAPPDMPSLPPSVDTDDEHWGHAHAAPSGEAETGPAAAAVNWANCCGIPVPSVFAAAAAEKEGVGMRQPGLRLGEMGSKGVRAVPFD